MQLNASFNNDAELKRPLLNIIVYILFTGFSWIPNSNMSKLNVVCYAWHVEWNI